MTTTRVLTVDREHPEPGTVAEAARVLLEGGLVVFPTETVYGLGATALSARAVERIFAAKERPATDPLIVHVLDLGGLAQVTRALPEGLPALAAAFWPGPLTVIVPRHPNLPAAVTAGADSVAVRIPAHPVARALLLAANVPVAAPSANRFSRPSPTRAEHVLADLDGRVDLILDGGPTPVGVESTIVDLTGSPPRLLRPGGVAFEALRELLPGLMVVERYSAETFAAQAPGQFLKHYAPRTPLQVFDGDPEACRDAMLAAARQAAARGLRVGALAFAEDLEALAAGGLARLETLGSERAIEQAAARLFDVLRALDEAGLDLLLARLPGPAGLGLALRDRLTRAAEGNVTRLSSTAVL
ncbi:MAG: threonylcarbamoyl-AMP synthase [Anaerolineales bacterium]|nr:threonylcarbamoyl-AMP synthase [Anaerolineales bacterium]